MTTKILALTDALGNLVRFELLPGQRFDTIGVPPLIEGVEFGALIADKAFDANAIIADLDTRGAKVVISQHSRLQAQGVQTHRHASRQNRSKLRRPDPARRRRDSITLNPNRP